MPMIIDQVADRAARLLLRTGTVRAVHDVNGSFRRVEVAAGRAAWAPGGKVQVRLRGTTFRTFTPFGWDERSVALLVHRHGHGPGPATDWVDALAPGSDVQMFGPRRSLDLTDLTGGPVFVGDETSFALAAAWAAHGAAGAAAQVFEVTSAADAQAALTHLGLGPSPLVERADGDAHHGELTGHVLAALARHPNAPLVLTGKAQTIRAVRGAVKDAGLAPTVRVKAHWDPNRTGLD